MLFRKATKAESKLRLALMGPSGSGKTYSALKVATALNVGPIALVDTERGSAKKYADIFTFDALDLESFHPQQYIDAMTAAAQAGYPLLILDSITHAWAGKDGALALVDQAAEREQSKNSFTAWRKVTPLHNALVDAMLQYPGHLIVTMRSKMAYELQEDDKGKKIPVKLGMAPIQREGMEYEFDVVVDLDVHNIGRVGKTRCPALTEKVFDKPGQELADILKGWLAGVNPEEQIAQERARIAEFMSTREMSEDEYEKGRKWMEAPRSLAALRAFSDSLSQRPAKAVKRQLRPVEPEKEKEPEQDDTLPIVDEATRATQEWVEQIEPRFAALTAEQQDRLAIAYGVGGPLSDVQPENREQFALDIAGFEQEKEAADAPVQEEVSQEEVSQVEQKATETAAVEEAAEEDKLTPDQERFALLARVKTAEDGVRWNGQSHKMEERKAHLNGVTDLMGADETLLQAYISWLEELARGQRRSNGGRRKRTVEA